MNEEIDLNEDIIMQIEMASYMKYNDTIASMNDHLGEMYGCSDVKDMEESQLKYEKELAYKTIGKLQTKLQQKENIIKEVREKLCKYGLVDKEGNFNAYLDTIELKELLEILDKGE